MKSADRRNVAKTSRFVHQEILTVTYQRILAQIKGFPFELKTLPIKITIYIANPFKVDRQKRREMTDIVVA